jgi:WD40 repeat protein
MAYVGEKTGTSYKLNKVDLDNPREKISRDIGGNVAVITASPDGTKIALIQAVEVGYETFAGAYTKVYDADTLALLKTIPLNPPGTEGRVVEPLHHRDPSLAVTDKYVAVVTEDDGFFSSGGVQHQISIYEIAGEKSSHTKAFLGNSGAARGDSALGIGTAVMGVAMNGDFLLVGGNAGTAAFKIGSDLALTKVDDSADTVGNHWFKDNGVYVLESKSNTGTVKVWKWNGASAPTAVGMVDVNGNNSGSVQALSFDPDNSAKAYFYCRLAAGTGNGGNVYSVDLTAQNLPKTVEFKFSQWAFSITAGRPATTTNYTSPLTGLWTIEKQGDYYVFSGNLSYTVAGATTASSLGTVLTVKKPATTGEEIAVNAVSEERFSDPFATAVRTLKTFKSTAGDIYFAAKNYTASTWNTSAYRLVLGKLD